MDEMPAEVEVTAGLEVPASLSLEQLQREVKMVCPHGSRFTYSKRWPRTDEFSVVRS